MDIFIATFSVSRAVPLTRERKKERERGKKEREGGREEGRKERKRKREKSLSRV